AVVTGVPAGGSAIAALVRSDHVITGLRDRQHDLAPAVCKLGKSMEQEHAGTAFVLEAGFEDVNRESVDVLHEPRADAGGQRVRAITSHFSHGRSPGRVSQDTLSNTTPRLQAGPVANHGRMIR